MVHSLKTDSLNWEIEREKSRAIESDSGITLIGESLGMTQKPCRSKRYKAEAGKETPWVRYN